jgi:NADH:ubiquinone oxidoreductase subunit 2 (subunit N)
LVLLSFLLKLVLVVFSSNIELFYLLAVFSGLGSICFASVAALYQKRIKRLLAYSAVSHTGFLLLGVCCLSIEAIKACTVYIVLYVIMSIALFGLLLILAIDNPQEKYLIS